MDPLNLSKASGIRDELKSACSEDRLLTLYDAQVGSGTLGLRTSYPALQTRNR